MAVLSFFRDPPYIAKGGGIYHDLVIVPVEWQVIPIFYALRAGGIVIVLLGALLALIIG